MPTERLIVEGTFKDGISPGLKKVGTEAETSEKKVDKLTSKDVSGLGSGMMNVAKTVATGLLDVATAASNLYEQQNFVNQVFGDAAPIIDDFAKKAAGAYGMSERAALEAAGSIGVFGLNIGMTGKDLADFSSNLVGLAGDMASVKNTKPEEAVNALAAAMRTQYRPIKEYGVVLNEPILKHRAFEMGIGDGISKLTAQQRVLATNAEVFAQLGFAVGDFNRTQDSMANSTRSAKADFENLQAHLGEALMPAFAGALGAASTLMEGLQKLPTPIVQIGGDIGLAAAGILGFGGAALFAIGKIGSMIETVRDMAGKFKEFRANASGAQNAMLTFGKVVGSVGIAVAGVQVAADIFNQITDQAGKMTTSIKEVNIALAAGKPNEAWKDFLDVAHHESSALKISKIWTDWGKTIQLAGSQVKRPIEDVDAAFKKMLDQSPDKASQILEILKQQTEQLDHNSGQYKDNQMIIERWGKQLDTSTQSMQAAGEAGQLATDTLKLHGDATLNDAKAMKESQDAYDEAQKSLEEYSKKVDEANRSFDTAKETAGAFGDSLKQVIGTPDIVDNAVAIKGAIFDLTDGFETGKGKAKKFSGALDENTDAGRKNIQAVDDLAGKIGDELVRVYTDSGGSIDAVNESAAKWRDELGKQLKAVGLNDTQVQQYIDTLNLTPDKIKTVVELKDQEIASKKLDMLNLKYDELPKTLSTQILAAVDSGDFIKAYDLASGYVKGAGPIEIQATADAMSANKAGADAQETAQQGATFMGPLVVGTVPDQSAASRAGFTAHATAQAAVPGPITMGSTFDPIAAAAAGAGAASTAQGAVYNHPMQSEIQVKPGDVKTPAGQNSAYVEKNPPEATIETKPGDYKTPKAQIDSYMANNDPVTTVKTTNADYYVTWSTIDSFFRNHPVQTTVNTKNEDQGATWGAINSYFGSHPISVKINADTGNISSTWTDIQTYFNNHPITVKVNTTQGTVSAPVVKTSSTAAMASMGLTSVGGTLMAAPAPVVAGQMAPTSTPSIVNLHVNMPAGTNENRVVDLLRRYQRQNGSMSLPRQR